MRIRISKHLATVRQCDHLYHPGTVGAGWAYCVSCRDVIPMAKTNH